VLAEFFITDLRKQKDQLEELISKLKQKELLDKEDLRFYDLTTQQIEKRLRILRRFISQEVSRNKNEITEQPRGNSV